MTEIEILNNMFELIQEKNLHNSQLKLENVYLKKTIKSQKKKLYS